MPAPPVLLAEVDGEPRAALSIADGSVVADPFHPTVTLLELLAARADQLWEGSLPVASRNAMFSGTVRSDRISA